MQKDTAEIETIFMGNQNFQGICASIQLEVFTIAKFSSPKQMEKKKTQIVLLV